MNRDGFVFAAFRAVRRVIHWRHGTRRTAHARARALEDADRSETMTTVAMTSVASVQGSSRARERRGEATTRRTGKVREAAWESGRRAAARTGWIARAAASGEGGESWLNLDDDRVDLNYVPKRGERRSRGCVECVRVD